MAKSKFDTWVELRAGNGEQQAQAHKMYLEEGRELRAQALARHRSLPESVKATIFYALYRALIDRASTEETDAELALEVESIDDMRKRGLEQLARYEELKNENVLAADVYFATHSMDIQKQRSAYEAFVEPTTTRRDLNETETLVRR